MSKEGTSGVRIRCRVCGCTFDRDADKCPKCSAPAALSQPVEEQVEKVKRPVYVCTICGHIHEENEKPERCENCGVGGELIEERRPARNRTWVCTVCGLRVQSENAPESCRKCNAPQELFRAERDGVARMRCSICGFEIEGDKAPKRCENCGVGGDMFEPVN
ncbi:MAG: rubredoxin-like domain-containing protein [Acutalibacteraceae bacterium]